MTKPNPYRTTMASAFLGYIVQATVCNFPPLLFVTFRTVYGVSLRELALLVTLTFAIQLVGDLIMPRLIDRIGAKAGIILANLLAATGLILLPHLSDGFGYGGIVASSMLYSTGASLIEVLVSPIVEACPSDNKAGTMSLLHSFFAWGCVLVIGLSTAYFALFGVTRWKLLSTLWAAVPIADSIMFLLAPMPVLNGGAEHRTPVKTLLRNKTMLLLMVLMVAGGAAELAVSQWASAFAEAGLRVPKATGDLLGPMFFAVLMGVGRLYHALRSSRLNLYRFLVVSAAVCAAGYLLISLSPWPIVSLLGCGAVGFGVAVLWPGALSIGSELLPWGGTTMFSLLACCGDVGCSLGPTSVGLVSDALSENLQLGILVGILYPLTALVVLGILRKQKKA